MNLDVTEIFKILRRAKSVSQGEMAEIGGVSLATQQNYEAGRTKPTTDYLRKIAAAGFDVNFLLTGERDARTLSAEDSWLLSIWHQAEPTLRSAALRVLLPNGRDGVAPLPSNYQTHITGNQGTVHSGSGDIHNHDVSSKTYCKDCNKILANIEEFQNYPICNPCISERRNNQGLIWERNFYNFSALVMIGASMALIINMLEDMEKAPVYLFFIITIYPFIKHVKKIFIDPWILKKLDKSLPFHN